MTEWKVLLGAKIEVQKTLNQWKHDYVITIHGFSIGDMNLVSVLLTRTRRNQ